MTYAASTMLLASAFLLLLRCASASTNIKVWVLSKQEMEGDGCDFYSYEAVRNNCEKMFSNVSVITSGNNSCSDVQIYITCVKDAMRMTLCSANDTIKENENARIMKNVRTKNVTCIPKSAPQNMRQMMSCHRAFALKKFFACSSTFHYYMKNKDDVPTIGNAADCSVTAGYKECVQLGLKHTECVDDKEFTEHVLYFMNNDIYGLAKFCLTESNSPNSNTTVREKWKRSFGCPLEPVGVCHGHELSSATRRAAAMRQTVSELGESHYDTDDTTLNQVSAET